MEVPGFTPGTEEAADDPQLRSLRAVWLSMPDEEPPQRGLAELMAAARVKAEEMAKPSLWQRIVALLRRPPVMALATVLVLIGGAVFIGQRRDKMQAEAPVATEHARDTYAGSAAVAPTTPVASGEGAVGGVPVAEPTPSPVTSVDAEQQKPESAKAERPRRPARRPTPSAKEMSRFEATTVEKPRVNDEKSAKGKHEEKLELELTQPTRGIAGGGGGARGDDRDKPVVVDSLASESPAESEPSTAPKAATQAPPPEQPTSRSAQYLAQARSAAARGDCAAVRVLMKRVAAEDAAVYRKAVASDAALKKCME
jgi:hypothetical protein